MAATTSIRVLVVLALALALALGACAPAAEVVRSEAPTVTDAWVRPPMGPDRPAAGYLVITASPEQGDALTGARSPVAASIEVHETTTGEGGMAGMQEVSRIEIPAASTVALEPGGYHLMLLGVTQDLVVGTMVELVLTFERGGEVVVMAEVRQG